MAKYVDAEKVIKYWKKEAPRDWNQTTAPSSWRQAYDLFIDFFKLVSEEEDVAPVIHAEWGPASSIWRHRYLCSNCKYKLFGQKTNFCPHCGAKMGRGE